MSERLATITEVPEPQNGEVPRVNVEDELKRKGIEIHFHQQPTSAASTVDSLANLVQALKQPKPASRWEKFMAGFWLVGFALIAILVLGTANVLATGEALNTMNPGLFGTKLSRFFPVLSRFVGWRMATLGHVFGCGFFCFTAFSWKLVASELFLVRGNDLPVAQFRVRNVNLVARITCGTLFVIDLVFFFVGSAAINRWAGGGASFSGLLITAMYGAVAVLFALGYMVLRHQYDSLQRS
jgi:hypothetical protein